MPQLALLFDFGEMHPCTLRDIFGWNDTMTAAMLDLSEQSMKSYQYQPSAKGRREPSAKTKSRTYDKCKLLLMGGQQPARPELLPKELRSLTSGAVMQATA